MTPAKTVGAFFDLDGTLLAPPSLERRFFFYLVRRGELGPAHVTRWLAQFLRMAAGNWRRATEGNKAYLAGLSTTLADEWVACAGSEALPWFEQGLRRLEWHAQRGDQIFIVSGSLAPLVRGIVRQLPVRVEVCATQLESCDGRWTGRVRGEHISCAAKAAAVRRLAAQYGVELAGSFAYGNCLSDRAMLETVGRPAAVNPSARLERLGTQREWPVLWWRATRKSERAPRCARLVANTYSEVQR